MNEISDKTWVLVLRGGDRHFLTDAEAGAVKDALVNGDKFLDLESVFFAKEEFAKLLHGADYSEAERRKLGDYYCNDHGRWVPRGKTCGYC